MTYGGYSGSTCLHEHFMMRIPDEIPIEMAGPILCAGITVYDPLKYWGACRGEKMTIGIVGIGGLGTMAIKMAKALGHRVVAISTNANKKKMALEKGADQFVVSSDI
jgi:D-arabinose 1-dehydrogenase-like Zn-dependent alcohol dehydrogenase